MNISQHEMENNEFVIWSKLEIKCKYKTLIIFLMLQSQSSYILSEYVSE